MKFTYGILTNNVDTIFSTKLGEPGTKFTDADINKAVKYSKTTNGTMVLCGVGDEIEGFVESLESFTQDGQTFGSVFGRGALIRQWVQADASLALGDYVVAAAQEAVGTNTGLRVHPSNNKGLTKVKKKDSGTSGWRVINTDKATQNVYLIEAVI